jgi:hypothetical protein
MRKEKKQSNHKLKNYKMIEGNFMEK